MLPRPLAYVLAGAALLLLGFGILRTAWVGDDAYITFRSIENWCAGHGLRWNVADRVQTFTCPLWLLVCALGRVCSGELYFTTLALSGVATAGTLWGLGRLAGGTAAALAAVGVAALSSRCFVDYSTSGLENPLSHLLLVAMAFVWRQGGRAGTPAAALRRAGLLGLCGALLATTRMDLALLAAPAVLAGAATAGWRRAVPRLALAALPFAAWLAFATFYYGTPFPSTSYAKLFAVGLPLGELALQGCRYVAVLVLRDPASAALIALAVVTSLRRSGRQFLPLALGILLYLAYVVRIGGDFMAGRFFSSTWVLATAILALRSRDLAPGARLGGAGALLALAFVPGVPAAFAGSGRAEDAYVEWKVHDVRQQGWVACGLLAPERRPVLANSITTLLREQMHQTEPAFEVHGVVGERGFQGGPLLHIVDPWLCDPVLCRLPTSVREDWQISHFTRRVPEGYLELLSRGDDRRCNPHFARFARGVLAVTRGELWSWERLRAAWALATGAYAEDLAAFVVGDYAQPPTPVVAVAELPPPVPPDTWWFRSRALVLYDGGLDLDFGGPQHAAALELELGPAAIYRCELRRGEQVLCSVNVRTDQDPELGGLKPRRLPLPPEAKGFTVLRIRPGYHSAVMAVGAVRVVP